MFKEVCERKQTLVLVKSRAMSKMVLFTFVTSNLIPWTQGSYRYTLDSCADLNPKLTQDPPEYHDHFQPTPGWRSEGRSDGSGGSSGIIRRTRDTYVHESLIRITASGKRYRRNTDVNVHVEASAYYDSIMVQGRAVKDGAFVNGGVGLLGRFDPGKLDRNFSYLECFRDQYGTVLDKGLARLGNVTLIWTAPDADKGDMRFSAGVLRGGHFWIIVSNILEFNPYPVSTTQCGGSEACFRICPFDTSGQCGSADAVLMYTHSTDLDAKRELEFTLGGKIANPQTSYLAVVYAQDNDNLYQADVTACFLENGKAKVEHYTLEVVGEPLYQTTEEISLVDYDYDGAMLWCRYRRPINHNHNQNSVISPGKTQYTLLYTGELNLMGYPRLRTPIRLDMYSSDRKYDFKTPVNIRYSGSTRPSELWMVVILMAICNLVFNS